MKKIDKTKKSNIKCEHCKNFKGQEVGECKLNGDKKYYYNRCKNFEWNKKLKYKTQKSKVGER